MGLLSHSAFQELFAVPIQNVKDVLCSHLFSVKTRKPLANIFWISRYKPGFYPLLSVEKNVRWLQFEGAQIWTGEPVPKYNEWTGNHF